MSNCGCWLIDCSDEGRARRHAWIASLQAKIFSGVQSISDRSRSESFRGVGDLLPLLDQLKREEFYCDNGVWPMPARRVFYKPMVKGL